MPKSKYDTHVLPNLDRIAMWAENGATTKAIAAKLKVAYSTFRRYVDEGEKGNEQYKALSAAFARACEVPDDEIETALFNRAKGITYDECIYQSIDGEEVCVKRVRKYIPPDPTSAIFWLTNRRPDKWKAKPECGDRDRDNGANGVVILAPVMDSPGPPKGDEGNG